MNIKKGFTLIELLIVIAIIGILAAVIIPNFTPAKKRASESNFIQSVKNYQSLFVLCCDQPNASITDPGQSNDICDPAINNPWPTGGQADIFGGGGSGSDCNYGEFSVEFIPTPGAFGDCTGAIVSNDGVYFQGCTSIENSTPQN